MSDMDTELSVFISAVQWTCPESCLDIRVKEAAIVI